EVVHLKNAALIAFQTGSITLQVATRADEIMIKLDDATIGVCLAPIHEQARVERLIFKHFLPLKNHGHSGRGQRDDGTERGKFSRPITVRGGWINRRYQPQTTIKIPPHVVRFEKRNASRTGCPAVANVVLNRVYDHRHVAT